MDFWEYMLARKQGSGSGGGGKSKVIQIDSNIEEYWANHPYIALSASDIFFKIGNDVITKDEFVGGVVGSAYVNASECGDHLKCFEIVADGAEYERDETLFAVDGADYGLPGATTVAMLGGDYVIISMNEEGAKNVSAFTGQEVSAGLWVHAIWMLFGADNGVVFALAYNAKEEEKEEWFNDGKTHIWIELQEGRTSPMMGLRVNGTVTVDWGDGTTPDVLTGKSMAASYDMMQWTPNHEYAKAGNYIITLSVSGEAGPYCSAGDTNTTSLLRFSKASNYVNAHYASSIRKVEFGDNINLSSVGALSYARKLASVKIPDNAISIGSSSFTNCNSLESLKLPEGITSMTSSMLIACYSLKSFTIPDTATDIPNSAFSNCVSLTNIAIPGGVTSIGASAFNLCIGMAYYDFTSHTAVPTLTAANAFNYIPGDCEIRVPAALAEEWKAATNWSTYADYIVGV